MLDFDISPFDISKKNLSEAIVYSNNNDYWKKLGDEWNVTPADAKKQRCGNCAAFIQTPEMMKCISDGLTGGERKDEFDSIDEAGELGYCEIFDFKCASARTCRAWITGGPVK